MSWFCNRASADDQISEYGSTADKIVFSGIFHPFARLR
jgi:hypothetical protein